MTTTAKVPTRERLLDAAAELIYREGVGVGIDALCRAAGVSKRSMYQLFDTKGEVLAAGLERRAPGYAAQLLPGEDVRTPRERILYVFRALEELSALPDYRGCPYLSVEVELKDPEHPAAQVARRVKQALTDFFREEARRGGAADPDLLARRLTLLFDGSSARAGAGVETLAGLAASTASVLLDASGMP